MFLALIECRKIKSVNGPDVTEGVCALLLLPPTLRPSVITLFQDELVSLRLCIRPSVTYTKQLSGNMLQACLVAFAMYLTSVSATVVASL